MSIVPPFADFAARLVQARLECAATIGRPLTEVEVARRIGVSKQAYNHYEAGRSMPKRDALRMLAAALGVNAAWLAWGEGPHQAAAATPPEVAALLDAVRAMQQEGKKPERSKPTRRRPKTG